MDNHSSIAKRTIQTCKYLNLASVTEEGKPWNTPLYFSYDEDFNIYWGSAQDSQHSKNIRHLPDVFLTIYPYSENAVGVYIEAQAYEISSDREIEMILEQSMNTRPLSEKVDSKLFAGESPLRLYKAVLQTVYISSPETAVKYQGLWVDFRKKVELK